jgi:hypothetical protein
LGVGVKHPHKIGERVVPGAEEHAIEVRNDGSVGEVGIDHAALPYNVLLDRRNPCDP